MGRLGLTLTAHHSAPPPQRPSPTPLSSSHWRIRHHRICYPPSCSSTCLTSGDILRCWIVHTSFFFLDAAPLLPLPPLNGLARLSSPMTRERGLCWLGRWRGWTVGAPGCRTNSLDPAAYRSLTGRLRLMEAPTAEARQGKVSMRWAVWWSLARAVLGVGPVDRWRSSPSAGSTMRVQGQWPPRFDGAHLGPNRGRHTGTLGNPMERRWDSRILSVGKPVGRGKGIGAAPTP
jgi:hypothetical protein